MSLIIYSKENCSSCIQTKRLLEARGVTFNEVKIDKDEAAKQFVLSQGHRTVPQLYLDGKLFIEGGYQGLASLPLEEFNKRIGESNASKQEIQHK